MKISIYISIFLFSINLFAKECTFSRANSAGESKYTEQHSINTNIPGHSLRVFSVEVTPKNPSKNCEGLTITKSVFWGMSNYQYKNGNVSGNWETTYNDGSTMFGTFTANSQSPKDSNKNSMSIGSNQVLGGTKTYKNVSGYGITKTEFNPEKKYISGESTIYYNVN
jgi:hypothetical protein